MLQMIAGLTLMMQCHLITEDDNTAFVSDNEVFQWLVAVLDCSVCGKLYRGLEFAVDELIDVITFRNVYFIILLLLFYYYYFLSTFSAHLEQLGVYFHVKVFSELIFQKPLT